MASALSAVWSFPGVGMPEIDTLVSRCIGGDTEAFRQLYRDHRPHVARLVQRILGPDAEAEDVIQETFVQVHRSLRSFEGSSMLSTWIHRIAVNVALQHIRRRKRLRAGPVLLSAEPPDRATDDPAPDDEAASNVRMRKLYEALEKISPKKRTVFVLHEVEGLAAEQIASMMGTPVVTVRTRLFYARKALYEALASDPAFGEFLPKGGKI